MHYNTIRDLLLLHFVFGTFVITLNEVDHSRFVKSVSDEELKSLVENQENVNTKNNTKWAINVFNKWREQRMEDIPQLHGMNADVRQNVRFPYSPRFEKLLNRPRKNLINC
jgi:hypothetical protein